VCLFHTGCAKFTCGVCDKRFTTKGHLNDHRKRHTGENLYPCTQCKNRFLSRSGMREHMNIHRGKYKCTECGKCCGSSHDLTTHRRSHSGEKPFECTVCGKRFTQSGDLVRHSRIHSGEKPYKCHVCDKAFSQSGVLNTHMRVHTGDKPYKCHVCDKCFKQSSNLQVHKRRVHSNKRPYHCPYCGKLFKTHIELKRHVRIHSDAKPYSCRHCSQCLDGLPDSSHIYWSHTMKVLGSHVTFVSRNLLHVVNWSNIHVDVMNEWSRMFAVNVQSVSVHRVNWDFIIWFTQTSNVSLVVYVTEVSNTLGLL